jgi:high-affinity iron transporter
MSRARALWLPAHLDYERLGAAYPVFGTANQEVNGSPQGLPGRVHNRFFSGFLRVEYGLWHGQGLAQLEPAATTLAAAVDGLVQAFPTMAMPGSDLVLSTEQILEGTMRSQMSGGTDEGSHTNLATAWANVQGTQMALTALAPILARKSPRLLGQLDHGLATVAAALKKYERAGGRWEPAQGLSTSQREHLDGELGGLLEQLAAVPGLLQTAGPGQGVSP